MSNLFSSKSFIARLRAEPYPIVRPKLKFRHNARLFIANSSCDYCNYACVNTCLLYRTSVTVTLHDSRTHYAAEDRAQRRSEEHTSELQSRFDLVCRLLLAKT